MVFVWEILEGLGSECAAGGFVVCVSVWEILERVWGSECAECGFVMCVSVWEILGGLGE